MASLTPPSYGDFDKSIRTLFEGYGFGAMKVKTDLPVLSQNGAIQVKSTMSLKNDSRKAQGNVEVVINKGALKFTEKVDADGLLQVSCTVKDKLLTGLETTGETVYNPETYHRSMALRNVYKRPHVHHTNDLEVDFLGKVWRASLAGSYPCGGMVGGEFMYETTLGRITNASVGVAYRANDFTACATWQGLVDFLVSVHQKVSPRLQVGAQFTSSPHRTNTNMILGARYQLDDHSFFKTKISSHGTLGLAYNYRLSQAGPAAHVTVSALIDTRRLNQPSHRLGVNLELS